ncbi:MAG: metallophosphoesterase [Phycisphaerales bacterium]|nr:metallophosphoesterase [Phycisphaerales bacterium]
MFDVIGDVHGHADELEDLLQLLGYAKKSGVYRHATRTAIFLGDWIDRGPKIRQTLEVVRAMVEAKSARAVIGNHEWNALAWATLRVAPKATDDASNHAANNAAGNATGNVSVQFGGNVSRVDNFNVHHHSTDAPHQWCRAHTEKNWRIHKATLEQLSATELSEWLNWFRGIAWWLDLGGLRCVHACWDATQIEVLVNAFGNSWTTTDEIIRAAHEYGTPVADATECILKGPEIALPPGLTLADPEGVARKVIRTKWFGDGQARTYADLCFPKREGVSADPLPIGVASATQRYGADQPPVFIGHYWIPATEEPEPLAPNVACVDYSVARGGRLMSYRWSGEKVLTKEHFAWVPVRLAQEQKNSQQENIIR